MKSRLNLDRSCKKLRQLGASLVEYSLLVCLISLVVIGSVRKVGVNAQCSLLKASNGLNDNVFALCASDQIMVEVGGTSGMIG